MLCLLFVTGLFHVAECLQGPSALLYMAVVPSFLRPGNILLYAYATSLSRHPSWTFRLFSHFGHVGNAAVNMGMQISL